MNHKFNDISLLNIYHQVPHNILKGKLAITDNLNVKETIAFSKIKDRILTKDIQYTSALLAFICTKGSMDIEVDFTTYTLTARSILIITHKQICNIHDISDDFRYLLVAIDDSLSTDPNASNNDPNRIQNILIENPFIHLSETTTKESIEIYKILKRKLGERSHPYQIEIIVGLIRTFFYNIFAELAQEGNPLPTTKNASKTNRQKTVFKAFIKAVGEHYATERNIKYYADLLCITPKYLSKIIFQMSGRFAGDYIRDYIVREAKALIQSKKYSMFDISILLNFSSQSSFTRFFKNATGMSPKEYQNNH